MVTGLDQLTRDLARALEQAPQPVLAAYLFGSHAQGRAHRESDVDIGVLLAWDHPDGARGRFEARLLLTTMLQAELRAGAVDLVVLNDAPPTFVRHVVTTGILAYCTDHEAEHALGRDAMLRAADLEPFLRRTRRIKLEGLKP